jgi:hypothetical protein
MSKSIFISCVFEDSHRIETIKSWATGKRLGDVVITHETEDKRILGKEAIKHHIKTKIQGASLIIVLIGQDPAPPIPSRGKLMIVINLKSLRNDHE